MPAVYAVQVQPTIFGSSASPILLANGGVISLNLGSKEAIAYIVGTTPATVTIGFTGSFEGQKVALISLSDVDTVTIHNAANIILNGMWIGASNSTLILSWDGSASLWREFSRNS